MQHVVHNGAADIIVADDLDFEARKKELPSVRSK